MNKRPSAMRATVLMLALALAGCGDGGGSGSVSSTPTPPAANYTKIVDMSGNRTFQTAGVQYSTNPPSQLANGVAQSMGNGVTVAYTASSDSYQLTAPDGTTVTFGPSNFVAGQSTATTAVYSKTTGTVLDTFTLTVPASSSITLSYMVIGTWGHRDTTGNIGTTRVAVGGSPTLNSDMPRSGSATYSIGIGGTGQSGEMNYTFAGNSTGTFSANFGSNSVSTTLNLSGAPIGGGTVQSFGAFTGTGTISSSGPGFSGTLSGTPANGVFAGSFFGPQAAEVGFAYYLSGASFSGAGAVVGAKQ